MPKWAKWLIGSLIFLLVVAGITAFILLGYVRPYRMAENTMPDRGEMVLYQQQNGTILITWPAGHNVDGYVIEVLRPVEVPADTSETQPPEDILYRANAGNSTEHYLPPLNPEELTIRIISYKHYNFIFPDERHTRFGERTMEITGVFQMPAISNLNYTADPDADIVSVDFDLAPNSTARMYQVADDGTLSPFRVLTEGKTTLTFSETGDLPMPGYDESYSFTFDTFTEFDGYTYYGLPTNRFSVVRSDLLGSTLTLECTNSGNNAFSFTWNETKGEHYEFQIYDTAKEQWLTLLKVPKDGTRACSTGQLGRYKDFTFRVIAVGAEVTPSEVQVSTGASVVYSTIWPIKELEVYTDTTKAEVLTTVKAAKALCVLDMKDGLFYVRTKEGYGYIDSNYCLINLPDMIGDICLYDIRNSYESLYTVHEYEIPTVTGEVVVGYEDVELSKGEYLVPLLYPVALKLEKAAFGTIVQGYKLKIYDAYRPKEATTELYDIAEALLPLPIPEETFSGEPVEDMPVLPEPGEGEEPRFLTYEELMTDFGRYKLNFFLAKGGSRHNQGLALDLTLTKRGEDLEMQTAMHDLSWYSEIKQNNKDAKKLRSIMESAGFGGLSSEWWHFQDNDAKNDLNPPSMKSGVTPEGWVADDNGWRYRKINGKFYKNCEKTIDKVTYVFDENGYVIE